MTKQEKNFKWRLPDGNFEEIFEALKDKKGLHIASEIVSTAILQNDIWEFKSPLHAVVRVMYECKKRNGFKSRYDVDKLESIAFSAVEQRHYTPANPIDREVARIDYINNLDATAYGIDLIKNGQAEDYVYYDYYRSTLVCAWIADSIAKNDITYAGFNRVDNRQEIASAIIYFLAILTDKQLMLFRRAIALYKKDASIKDGLAGQYRSLALATKQIGLTPVEACEVYLRHRPRAS